MKTKLFALVMLLIGVASCSSDKSTVDKKTEEASNKTLSVSNLTIETLNDSKWNIVAFDDNSDYELDKSVDVILEFDSLAVGGNAGCNTFMANYSLNDSKIQFTNFGVTKMACDAEKAKFEELYLKALSEELVVEILDDSTLVLRNADKGVEIKYNKIK